MSDFSTTDNKRCSKCGEWKPRSNFAIDKRKPDGLRCSCKECNRDYQRQYHVLHQDQKRENARRWREENPYRRRKHTREYYREHQNQRREYHHLWSANNPDKAREHGRRRRARLADLPFDFTAVDKARAFDYWHGCCAVCGRPLRDLFGEHQPTLDHWITLSDPRPDNPGTVPTNMIPLCGGINGCNETKGTQDPLEWLIETYGSQKAKRIAARIETFFDWIKESRQLS